ISLLLTLPAQRNALDRLLEIATAEPSGPPSDEARPAAETATAANGVTLELSGVSIVANGQQILAEVDLHVPPSQHIAVVGPSGAGKSSLAGLLLGFHSPSTGTLRVDGVPLSERSLEKLRMQTAWVDPGGQLWNDTLLANLEYAARGTTRRDLLETLEASDV